MKEKIKTYTEKTLEFPTRIYTKKDLDRMQVAFVENQIFLNKVKIKEEFPAVSEDIKDNMVGGIIHLINLWPFLSIFFSTSRLRFFRREEKKNVQLLMRS